MIKIFRFLSDYSSQPADIDRLIISSFVKANKLLIQHNLHLKSFLILEEQEQEFKILEEFLVKIDEMTEDFTFEVLIALFEFVISPADRVINGAIYTPSLIREFIIDEVLKVQSLTVNNFKVADISCGCGGFLFNVARTIKEQTGLSFYHIFSHYIFGLDIQSYSITRTKLLLSLLALDAGEDVPSFNFNLYIGDALSFKWENVIEQFAGFNIIVGNPPYVRLRNLNEGTKVLLQNWEVCKTGLTDLYIPFFQIGIENLSSNGVLGYITMNTFFKSLNGRALREYFQKKHLGFKIIDFGSDQIFKSKNTYTCICIIQNLNNEFIEYTSIKKESLNATLYFNKIKYIGLDSMRGWNMQEDNIISKIESTGKPFGDLYKTRHGIATLKNSIYIFKPFDSDDNFYYLKNKDKIIFKIERGACLEIVNSNRLRDVPIDELKEKVIFPYNQDQKPKLLSEEVLKTIFPYTYSYLLHNRHLLEKRDKGNGKYENWFAFGRTQSLEKIKTKLFFPKMTNASLNCIIEADENLLYYNGQAIVGHSTNELIIIKKLMESNIFWYYIKRTSKPYSSDYYSIDGTYIRNFGVCDLTDVESKFVIKEKNKEVLNNFWEMKYGVSIK